MSVQAPIWLSLNFVQSLLRNSENDETLRINYFTLKAATTIGDNYMSDIIRVGLKFTRDKSGQRVEEKRSLIMKMSPTSESQNTAVVKQIRAFETEIEMMEETLVKMNEILNEKNYRLCPRLLYSKIKDPTFLVMEDLAELGFRMAKQKTCLDLQHCILAIRGLAKFHASSVAIHEKNPQSMKSYTMGPFHDDYPKKIKKFFGDGLRSLSNEVANWTELEAWYSKKLFKLSKVCYEKAAQCTRPRDDEFNVLNHGDCWVKNMLFRYDNEGNVIDHIFVDFQFCHWSSPAIDLSHFFNTSLLNEVDVHHRDDDLLDLYHKTLTQTMSKLGCRKKSPSMNSLRKYLREREFLAITSSGVSFPFVFIDKSEAVGSLDEVIDHEDGYANPGLKAKAYRKIMVRRLRAWNSRGLLDV